MLKGDPHMHYRYIPPTQGWGDNKAGYEGSRMETKHIYNKNVKVMRLVFISHT